MQDMGSNQVSQSPPQAGRNIHRAASPTEMVYITTHLIVVSRSSIAGALSREQFEAAVALLEARYGILRSVVEAGSFVARTDGRSSVETWLPANACTADAMYGTLLNADLDTGKQVYSTHVIEGDNARDIYMLSSHAVTDATSLIELHSALAYMCDCVVRGVDPALPAQPFPFPVDAAVDRAMASLPGKFHPSTYFGTYAEIPMHTPYNGGPVKHRLARIVIDANTLHRIKTTSHSHGVSVHSLLLASFALAIRDVAAEQPKQILMRSSVDMRRRLEPHVDTDLVFTAITGHITPVFALDRPVDEIARTIFDDIHEGMANGSIFHDYVNYPKAFGSPQQAPVAMNVSDMQSVQFHWPTERLKVTGFEYALGWLKKFPNVSVSVFDDTMIANIVYVEEFVDPAVMQAITEKFVRRLAG